MRMKSLSAIIFGIFIASAAFIFQSCCKEYCGDENLVPVLTFYGFKADELEKIKVSRFNKNDFTTPVESFYISMTNVIVRDTTLVYPEKMLSIDFNYKIDIEKTGSVYSITNIETKTNNCRCSNGKYESIVSYKVNAVTQPYLPFGIEIKK